MDTAWRGVDAACVWSCHRLLRQRCRDYSDAARTTTEWDKMFSSLEPLCPLQAASTAP